MTWSDLVLKDHGVCVKKQKKVVVVTHREPPLILLSVMSPALLPQPVRAPLFLLQEAELLSPSPESEWFFPWTLSIMMQRMWHSHVSGRIPKENGWFLPLDTQLSCWEEHKVHSHTTQRATDCDQWSLLSILRAAGTVVRPVTVSSWTPSPAKVSLISVAQDNRNGKEKLYHFIYHVRGK